MGVEAAVVGGAALGLVGAVTGAEATREASRSANSAAQAQLAEQQRARAEETARIERYRTEALQYAQPSVNELAMLTSANTAAQQDLERTTRLLNSVDPALMEAGKQATELMQGKGAAALEPVRRNRALQRQKLEAQLKSQLGSGYASSTAGMQALSNFDAQTNDLMSQQQQQTLQQFLGVSQNIGVSYRPSQSANLFGNLASAYGNIQGRLANAALATSTQPQQQITMAGAGNLSTNANQPYATLASQFGGTLLGYGMQSGLNNQYANNAALSNVNSWAGTQLPASNTLGVLA